MTEESAAVVIRLDELRPKATASQSGFLRWVNMYRLAAVTKKAWPSRCPARTAKKAEIAYRRSSEIALNFRAIQNYSRRHRNLRRGMVLIRTWASRLFTPTLLAVCAVTASSRANDSPNSAQYPRKYVMVRDCKKICPELVLINSGSFQMGAPNDQAASHGVASIPRTSAEPRHEVRIARAFWLARFDVTRAQYRYFVRDSGYQSDGNCLGNGKKPDWQNPGYDQTENDPVVCVNWNDISRYLTWLSRKTHKAYRLPTEAEWEFAAEAGSEHKAADCRSANALDLTYMSAKHYPLSSVQRYNCFDGYVYTAPVGSFSPNAFGLYDMLGNVQQWVEDCWHENYVGAPSNGLSWSSKSCPAHVLRGTRFDMGPEYTRYYYRTFSGPSVRDDAIGFRVARDN